MNPQRDLIIEGDWLSSSGELGLFRLLEKRPDMDAIFACNDQMALGAMKAARYMGRRIPDDLAIVGFDDIPEGAYFCPPLTTVRQDMTALGHSAMRELSRLMDALQEGKDGVEPNTIWIQPQLVIRESSASSKTAVET